MNNPFLLAQADPELEKMQAYCKLLREILDGPACIDEFAYMPGIEMYIEPHQLKSSRIPSSCRALRSIFAIESRHVVALEVLEDVVSLYKPWWP
jgi:hypothetical protein